MSRNNKIITSVLVTLVLLIFSGYFWINYFTLRKSIQPIPEEFSEQPTESSIPNPIPTKPTKPIALATDTLPITSEPKTPDGRYWPKLGEILVISASPEKWSHWIRVPAGSIYKIEPAGEIAILFFDDKIIRGGPGIFNDIGRKKGLFQIRSIEIKPVRVIISTSKPR